LIFKLGEGIAEMGRGVLTLRYFLLALSNEVLKLLALHTVGIGKPLKVVVWQRMINHNAFIANWHLKEANGKYVILVSINNNLPREKIDLKKCRRGKTRRGDRNVVLSNDALH
jgi:hypothetical protein